ncbi:MAG: hypothetical protein ABIQ30_10170 [Devosia sp.]
MSDQIPDNVISLSKALVDAVAFDDCGRIIGGQLVGGNGGLLSREAIKAADQLRLALSEHAAGRVANLATLELSPVETEAVTP